MTDWNYAKLKKAPCHYYGSCYEGVLLETLPKEATEEMLTSGFDLSLYTCTPGGTNRVTVRCNAVEMR